MISESYYEFSVFQSLLIQTPRSKKYQIISLARIFFEVWMFHLTNQFKLTNY